MRPPSTPAATNPPAASVHAVVQELPQQAPAPDPGWETEQKLLQAVKVARDVEPPKPLQLASALGELASWLVTQQRTLGARGELTEALGSPRARQRSPYR